jgi:hypothetical protein
VQIALNIKQKGIIQNAKKNESSQGRRADFDHDTFKSFRSDDK